MGNPLYKDILVVGAALVPPTSRRRRNATRKNRSQEGGDNSGALLQLSAQSAPAGIPDPNAQTLAQNAAAATAAAMRHLGPTAIQTGGSGNGSVVQLTAGRAPTTPGAPAPVESVSGVSAEQPAPFSGGGKLVLAAPKRKTRIALKAPKHKKNEVLLVGGTRKAPRKIQIRARGVTARLQKAKKAAKQAASAPIADIKTRLEGAGVIKKGSKAPEAMLRNMYADLLITKKGL